MAALTDFMINKKRFFLQIIIAIGISVIFQLVVDPLIYDPFIRDQMSGLFEAGDAIVICSLSMWFFAFSISFFIYRNNHIINNYLLCAFFPLVIIVAFEFGSLFFIDFLHIPPVIIIFIILWRYRSTLRLKNVAITSIILIIWAATIRLIGTNYTRVPLFPMGLLAIIFWPIMNLLLIYLIIYFERRRKA